MVVGRFTKPCINPECAGVVACSTLAELKNRKYCSRRCSNRITAAAASKGWQDKALWRACMDIQKALGIEGNPPPELIRVVRHLRHRAYQAGWSVVVGKLRRSVARGVLVRKNKSGAVA